MSLLESEGQIRAGLQVIMSRRGFLRSAAGGLAMVLTDCSTNQVQDYTPPFRPMLPPVPNEDKERPSPYKVHMYDRPTVSIEHVGVTAVYFRPKGKDVPDNPNWRKNIEATMGPVFAFFTRELQGNIDFRLRTVKVDGKYDDQTYGAGYLGIVAKEVGDAAYKSNGIKFDKEFLKKAPRDEYQVAVIFYEPPERIQNAFESFSLTISGGLGLSHWVYTGADGLISGYYDGSIGDGYDANGRSQVKYVQLQSPIQVAHEFGHALGMQHSFSDPDLGEAVDGNLMDNIRKSKEPEITLMDFFIRPEQKRKLGIE